MAQDGSLYWALAAKAPAPPVAPTPADIDVFSAMHSSSDMLAQNWYTGTAADKSSAIDKGTPDYISGGGTSTQFMLTGDTSLADNTLPKGYLEGYIRKMTYGWETDEETADQEAQLARRLDLGFHYGGQVQDNAPSNTTGDGYITLAPSIRTMPRFPATSGSEWGFPSFTGQEQGYTSFWDYSVETEDDQRTLPIFTLVSHGQGNPGTTNNWLTGSTVFAVKTSIIGNGMGPDYVQPVDVLYALEMDDAGSYSSSGWIPVFDESSLWEHAWFTNGQYQFVPSLKSSTRITSIDATAFPSGDKMLAVRQFKQVRTGLPDDGIYTMAYLFHRVNGVWTPVSGTPITYHRSAADGFMTPYGAIALACDNRANSGAGEVHMFWTEWNRVINDNTNTIWHSEYSGSDTASPESMNDVNDLDESLLADSQKDYAGQTISAAYEDRTAKTRAIWPEMIDGAFTAIVGSFYRDEDLTPHFTRTPLVSETGDTGAKHIVNSIASGHSFTDGQIPAWLKSSDLAIGSSAISATDYTKTRRWLCKSTLNQGVWDDDWTVINALNPIESSRGRAVTASRGLRLPRQVCIAGPGNSKVLSDGRSLLQNSDGLVLKSSASNYLDQYLLSRPYMWATGTVHCVTRMQP